MDFVLGKKNVRHFILQDSLNIYCKGKKIHMILIYLNVLKLDIGKASYICIFLREETFYFIEIERG